MIKNLINIPNLVYFMMENWILDLNKKFLGYRQSSQHANAPKNLFLKVFLRRIIIVLVQHNESISFGEVGIKEQLAMNS